MNNAKKFFHAQQGLTLIEVLIAAFIMAVIGIISFQSLNSTVNSKEVVEENLDKLARLDRTWLLLETDLRNVVSASRRQVYGVGSGSDIPPLIVDNSDGGRGYWLTALRGGHANPLNFARSEVIRVGYRVQEDTLWRDVWNDLASVDVEQARSQKIIEGVEGVVVRILSDNAQSFTSGPWVDRWPQEENALALPMALEITVDFEKYGEITRLYSVVKGEGGEATVGSSANGENPVPSPVSGGTGGEPDRGEDEN